MTNTIGMLSVNFTFNIIVKHSCTSTSFPSYTANPMSYQISAAATQATPFLNTVATAKLNPTYCGANIFSFSPTKTFLMSSGNSFSVFTSNPADVGNHIIDVTV